MAKRSFRVIRLGKIDLKPIRLKLRLYVAGTGPRSVRAMQTIKRICEAEVKGSYDLEIIDLYRQPDRAKQDQIVAAPTLVKHAPGVIRRLVCDLSHEARVRQNLGLVAT
jgi:circadian clock protein KaiB